MSKGRAAAIVQSSKDFAEVASKLMPSSTVILINDNHIPRDAMNSDFAEAIPGIKSVHVVSAQPKQNLELLLNALTPLMTPTKQNPSATSSIVDTFTPKDWVLVRYLTQTYPGIVKKLWEQRLKFPS